MRALRTFHHLRRYRHIMAVLIKYGFEETVASLGRRNRRAGLHGNGAYKGHTRPQRLRMALEELGPTFIKFGQLLSTRPDLLPPEYIHELENLQDQVRPVEFSEIRSAVEGELGSTLEQRFTSFEPVPIAAGSIAQVHQAVTLEGYLVAVKVRRPGMVQTIRTECEILENTSGLIKANLPRSETIDPVRLVQEFIEAVGRETDLANELRNLQRFERNFEKDPTVHIPRAYPDYSTAGVLTMEFIKGVKLNNRQVVIDAGLDPDLLARRGADFVLKQMFDFGLFHTDPHPGNLLGMEGNKVAVLDLGQVARLSPETQELLGELVLAILDEDAERLIRAFDRQEMLTEATNVRQLRWEIEELLEVYHRTPVKDIPFGRMMANTFEAIRRNHVSPPPEFTMMLKSLMTIESLSKGLSSDFDLLGRLRPYARRITLGRLGPGRMFTSAAESLRDAARLAERLPGDMLSILTKLRRGEFKAQVHHEHLDDLVRTLNFSSNRISFALIIAGLLVGSSQLVTQQGMVLGFIRVQVLGVLGYIAAVVLGLWVLVSILRSRHI